MKKLFVKTIEFLKTCIFGPSITLQDFHGTVNEVSSVVLLEARRQRELGADPKAIRAACRLEAKRQIQGA